MNDKHPSESGVAKVQSKHSSCGEMGQLGLASGTNVGMRLWDQELPGTAKPLTRRDYETVGYVIEGRAELQTEGQKLLLAPGDSWIVPKGVAHSYTILKVFTAVEATSPPAFVRGRDEP